MTAQATFCATLVDEWVRAGVQHAVVAPGSRSTPLALALLARPELHVDVFHDERAAAFAALGVGLATGRPAVVLTTSGTAATHLHAAVVEADLACVPMLVCTADRPPELRDVGAPQTIDQTHLFGRAPRWYFDPGVADDATRHTWRALAARAAAMAVAEPPGPVHLNLPFRDPLVGDAGELPAGRAARAPWVTAAAADPSTIAAPAGRTLLVGDWSGHLGFPVLATARNRAEGPGLVPHADAILRVFDQKPDVVIRAGAQPSSRVVNEWLAASGAHEIVVAPVWRDPSHTAAQFAGGVRLAEPDHDWMAHWSVAANRASTAVGELLDAPLTLSEPFVARALVRSLPAGAALIAASSMPVRDVEWYGLPRADIDVFANRGANGIDGTISTAIGVARARGAPTAVLLGDIAFLHDSTALIGVRDRGVALTIVVLDNDGGGIFSFLPQATAVAPPAFETLFGTPHGVRPEELAAAHGIASLTVDDPAAFVPAEQSTLGAGGVWLVVVRTNREENVKVHAALNEAVARALRPDEG